MWNSPPRPLNQGQQGLTLIELLIAIVVLGVGLTGVLLALNVVTRGSADPLVTHQMLAIAAEMLEEIELKPFAPLANSAAAPCARVTYNDLADYDGYATNGQICTIDGTPIPTLAGYSVSVSVQTAPLAGVAQAKRIVVTVTRGTATLQLVGWRTDFAS